MKKQELAAKVDTFIIFSARRNLSSATLRLYQTVLDEMVSFWPGDGPRQALTTYIHSLNNKPGTIKVKTVICRRFWNWMMKNGYSKNNPTDHIEQVKIKETRTRFLSKEEMVAILDHSSPTMKTIVTVALMTGLRRSTVLGLRWEDIDMHNLMITTRTKGGKIARIPITKPLAVALQQHRGVGNGVFLFPNKKGIGPVDGNALIEFRLTCQKLGLHDVCFHTLRHSFASHFLKATKNIYLLKELLGHANVSTTQRYAHIMDEDRVEGIASFSNSLGL